MRSCRWRIPTRRAAETAYLRLWCQQGRGRQRAMAASSLEDAAAARRPIKRVARSPRPLLLRRQHRMAAEATIAVLRARSQTGPRLRIQLASGEFRDLALETRKVNSMAKLQDAVADACERDLPASEQDRLGELAQVIEADGVARTVTEKMATQQLLAARELRLVAKAAAVAAPPPASRAPKLPPPPANGSEPESKRASDLVDFD